MRRQRTKESGFTLIEILIALSVMAAASVVLIGMQSAAIARAVRDRNAQQGMFLARRIMASIEAQADKPQDIPTFENEGAFGVLQRLNIPEPTDEISKRAMAPFQITLTSSNLQIPLPNVNQDPLKKFSLRIAWGPGLDESFIVTHLIPIP